MLVPMSAILGHARAEGYGVGAFDVPNLETATAVLEAAQQLNSPVIIAVPPSVLAFQHFEVFVHGIRMLADPLDVPVAIILDHGQSYEICMRAIKAGMTAVMFDGSKLPFEENVRITKEIVKVAHSLNVSVEAEVGHVGSGDMTPEQIANLLTDPEKAAQFVEQTGVDCLAVAVGTIHGHYRGEPQIRFELIEKIATLTQIPLVLHGGSSTGEQNLRKAIECGINKINVFSDMSAEAVDRMKSLLSSNARPRINDVLLSARDGFGKVSGYYMKLFGSNGKG